LISSDEDISYEILVHKKRYEAIYFQMPNDADGFLKDMKSHFSTIFSEEELSNPNEEIATPWLHLG
jgi:hypothetical protein